MITNTFLNTICAAINDETFMTPSYLAVATTVVSAILSTDSALSGEIGSRESMTGTRVNNIVTYDAIRSGVDVINTQTGDVLTSFGLFPLSTGPNLLSGVVVSGVTHTTNFDIEIITQIKVDRA